MVFGMKNSILLATASAVLLNVGAFAQHVPADRLPHSKFRQLEQELPTPNSYRNAAGAPGLVELKRRGELTGMLQAAGAL